MSSMLGGCFRCDAQPFFAFFDGIKTGPSPSSSGGGGGGGGMSVGGGGGMFSAGGGGGRIVSVIARGIRRAAASS